MGRQPASERCAMCTEKPGPAGVVSLSITLISSSTASRSNLGGRLARYVSYCEGSPSPGSTSLTTSACTKKGTPAFLKKGRAAAMSLASTFAKSLMPLGHMKLLKPSAPCETSFCRTLWSLAFSGTRPAQKPMFTAALTLAIFCFSSSCVRVVVTGLLLSGMSTAVVMPPIAAAAVPLAMPSHSTRPGSLKCTWTSITPGETTRSLKCRTCVPVMEASLSIFWIRPLLTWIVAGWMPLGSTTLLLTIA
mmetsp:Transcript_27935/g.61326  ORF Transcript_27935/g.61326 Transcript_27935/m.61326 type:complete len:248 (-) Transcript_27935:299-1042(-)